MTALNSCVFLSNYKPTLFSLSCKTFRTLLVFKGIYVTHLEEGGEEATGGEGVVKVRVDGGGEGTQ